MTSDPRGTCPRDLPLHRLLVGPENAPPVLLLHGLTGSRRYWLPRAAPLARDFRLIVPDLPGFGLSPKPRAEYTAEFFTESLLGLLDREGFASRRVHVVGHSLGALLALELMRLAPERFMRAVLISLPRFNDPEDAHRVWVQGSSQYRTLLTVNSVGATWSHLRRTGWVRTVRSVRRLPWATLADARSFTYRSITSTLEHCLLQKKVDAVLDAVPRLPILLLHGDADQVAPVERILELPLRNPFPTVRVVRGAGHHPLHTHSALCLRWIGRHLDATVAPGASREGGTGTPAHRFPGEFAGA